MKLKSQMLWAVVAVAVGDSAPFLPPHRCTPRTRIGSAERRMRWGFSSSVGGTGSRARAGGRARGPNLSRSIDAVIRALNFIRSAVRSARTKCCIFCHAAAVARIMTPYDASDQTAEATHTRRNKKATSFCPRFTHEREFLRLRARPIRTTATAVFAHPPRARATRRRRPLLP